MSGKHRLRSVTKTYVDVVTEGDERRFRVGTVLFEDLRGARPIEVFHCGRAVQDRERFLPGDRLVLNIHPQDFLAKMAPMAVQASP